jgi:hypothetical protein
MRSSKLQNTLVLAMLLLCSVSQPLNATGWQGWSWDQTPLNIDGRLIYWEATYTYMPLMTEVSIYYECDLQVNVSCSGYWSDGSFFLEDGLGGINPGFSLGITMQEWQNDTLSRGNGESYFVRGEMQNPE